MVLKKGPGDKNPGFAYRLIQHLENYHAQRAQNDISSSFS